jgi:hypothetical protein
MRANFVLSSPPAVFDISQIRWIQVSVTKTIKIRIIQPVHDELNQLALGFLGKK